MKNRRKEDYYVSVFSSTVHGEFAVKATWPSDAAAIAKIIDPRAERKAVLNVKSIPSSTPIYGICRIV